jgi:hypothetical protein
MGSGPSCHLILFINIISDAFTVSIISWHSRWTVSKTLPKLGLAFPDPPPLRPSNGDVFFGAQAMWMLYCRSFWKASYKSSTPAAQTPGAARWWVLWTQPPRSGVTLALEGDELNRNEVVWVMAKLLNNICPVPGCTWHSDGHTSKQLSFPPSPPSAITVFMYTFYTQWASRRLLCSLYA